LFTSVAGQKVAKGFHTNNDCKYICNLEMKEKSLLHSMAPERSNQIISGGHSTFSNTLTSDIKGTVINYLNNSLRAQGQQEKEKQ